MGPESGLWTRYCSVDRERKGASRLARKAMRFALSADRRHRRRVVWRSALEPRRTLQEVHCCPVPEHAGDSGSFEELAMPLFARLYNFAHWLTQERAAAEDLVQETYLKALRGFGSFREGTNFRAWMFRILRNTFLTSRAGLKTMEPLDDELVEEIAEEGTPETHFLNRANGEALQQAIAALPLPFREV